MVISRWKRGKEEAEVVENVGYFVAWNTTRGTFAVTPADAVEFDSAAEAEAALCKDGWEEAL